MNSVFRECMRLFPRAARAVSARALLSLLLISCAGCSHGPYPLLPEAPPPPLAPVLSDDYILQPNDSVEIKFLNNPELNDTLTIRPDGKISLQMIDDVRAAGLTPAQLDDLLTQKFSLLLNRAMITVVVRAFTNDLVYVGGEVRHPQTIRLTGRMNVLQAVFMAGGFRPDARMSDVMVVSRGPDNKPLARRVNLKRAISGDLDFDEYRLRPWDMVYVPRTSIANLDQFMTHLYRLLPPQVSFWFTYEVHEAEPE